MQSKKIFIIILFSLIIISCAKEKKNNETSNNNQNTKVFEENKIKADLSKENTEQINLNMINDASGDHTEIISTQEKENNIEVMAPKTDNNTEEIFIPRTENNTEIIVPKTDNNTDTTLILESENNTEVIFVPETENNIEINNKQKNIIDLDKIIEVPEIIDVNIIEEKKDTAKKVIFTDKDLKIDRIHPDVKVTDVKKRYIQKITKKLLTSKKKQVAKRNPFLGKILPVTRFISSGGEVLDLNSYQNKKIVLIILRGFAGGVCLVCSGQTFALSKSVAKFEEKNAQIIIVYPGKAESIPQFLSSLQLLEKNFSSPFPVVLDVELELVRNLSINGSLAQPTSIIANSSGEIEYIYVGKNISDRPTIDTLLKEIDNLSKR